MIQVLVDYDEATGYLTDPLTKAYIGCYMGLKSVSGKAETANPQQPTSAEDLIRIMKIAAHIQDPSKVKNL